MYCHNVIKALKTPMQKKSHMVAKKVLCNDSAPKSVSALQRGGLHQPEKKYPDSASTLCAWLFLWIHSPGIGPYFYSPSLSVYWWVSGEGDGALHMHMGLPSLGMAARLEVIYGLLQVMFHHWLFFPHQILHHQPMNIFFGHLLTPQWIDILSSSIFFCLKLLILSVYTESEMYCYRKPQQIYS